MLKSTYQPAISTSAALPSGWTEHEAPGGQTYYYHVVTKTSTYTRPIISATQQPPAQPVPLVNLSDPRAANAYLANQSRTAEQNIGQGTQERRGYGTDNTRPRPQPSDKPRSAVLIPGCSPWQLVYTKLGRRFAHNPDKNVSYWRIPDKLKQGVLQLDHARIQDKAGLVGERPKENIVAEQVKTSEDEDKDPEATNKQTDARPHAEADAEEFASDEYEEVEVTDDEDDEGQGIKRRRLDDHDTTDADRVVEFSEADMAYQLQAMGVEYDLAPGEYDDGNMEEWPEGAEGLDTTQEEAEAVFRSLLDDLHINPYSPWDKLVEDGQIIEDVRYTVLPTTKARKEIWEVWSRDEIRILREERARAEKADPRIAYIAFLQDKATPKLYWPEFKRKFKKEAEIKDASLADKDREKLYRDHVSRLKLPQARLKADLTVMLKACAQLSNKTVTSHLPLQILADIRYISLPPAIRDPLIEAYIGTLPPPSGDGDDVVDTRVQKFQSRKKYELSNVDNQSAEKLRQERRLQQSKARLREEERALEAAMGVDKRGLQSQLSR